MSPLISAAPVAHGVLDGMGQTAWTWIIDLPAAALTLWLTVRWGFVQSLRNRLLLMLHIGFVWYGLGFLLMTSQRRGLTEHIVAILILIGLLAYGIDRLLYWFQRGLFPYRTSGE